MADSKIEFVLDTGYHYGETLLNPGNYSVSITDSKMILEGKDVFIIKEDDIILLPVFRTNSFLLKNVTIGIHFHWEQKEDQRFTGGVRFLMENGKIRVINTVYLEDYLKSVISSEMNPASSMGLLKAHAVISRSWLLAQLNKNKQLSGSDEKYQTRFVSPDRIICWYDREDHSDFDVCADDHCQRYQGITKIIGAAASEAVETTMGEILWEGEEICDARFSKCCGGISESFENVWEPKKKRYLSSIADAEPLGHLPGVDLTSEKEAEKWILSLPDAFCNTSDSKIIAQVLPDFDRKTHDFFRWQVEYSQEQLSELIKQRSGRDFGNILALEPVERGHSGRIIELRIVGTRETIVVGKELEIRKWLSSTHLYSSAFIVRYEDMKGGIPGRIILLGAGWGHGVGLCQIGAAVMGEKGFGYREILAHYFKNAIIKSYYQ